MLVALDTLVADTSVDHHDRHMQLPRRLEEVRPELRLDGQVDTRPDTAQHMTREPRQVEREINDGIGVLDDAVRHLIAARRHDGDEDRAFRELLAELLDERARRDDLANGCRVHPNAVLLFHLVERMLREKAETLPDAFHKSLFPHRAHHEHRDDEHPDEDGRDVVE